MNPDFVDLLRAFIAAEVRFIVVGAYAVALYSKPRATGRPKDLADLESLEG